MRVNSVKHRLREGKPVVGILLGFNSPAFVEMSALAGFDYAMFDCEHGAMSIESVENLVRTADAAGITPLARVPQNGPSTILRFLDTGLMGVMVPHIETADDARAAVRAAKYPPMGERGLGPIRASSYGATMSNADYMKQANEETMVIALLESKRAVENIEEIVRVPGVDLFQIGPTDLSVSMGYAGQSTHPDVQAAVDRIIAVVRGAGGLVGMGGTRGAEACGKLLARGVSSVSVNPRDLVVDGGRAFLAQMGVR